MRLCQRTEKFHAISRLDDGIIEVGRLLIEAKEELPHGEFIAMVESELPFKERAARCLMAVARDERISNRQHAAVMPPSWYTLYAISLRRAVCLGVSSFRHKFSSISARQSSAKPEGRMLRQ
jgi:hypothetical protein